MHFFFQMFNVKQEQICIVQNPFKILPACMSAGIHNGMQPSSLRKLQQCFQRVDLHHGLPARKGNTTSGLLVKDNVFLNFSHDVGQSHLPARHLKSLRWARLCTGAAADALFAIYFDLVTIGRQSALLTNLNAKLAANAFLVEVDEFRLRENAFGIVTPGAGQGTALEENRRPDAWPVIDGKFLYVEDRGVQALTSFCVMKGRVPPFEYLSRAAPGYSDYSSVLVFSLLPASMAK
jgi:hypothetical protein